MSHELDELIGDGKNVAMWVVLTTTGCDQCEPQSVDLTKLIVSTPCELNASKAT